MGTHNRQRRAAKQRKRSKARAGHPPGSDRTGGFHGAPFDAHDEHTWAARLVASVVSAVGCDPRSAKQHALSLLGPESPVPPSLAATLVHEMLGNLLRTAIRGGWTPADLGEITRRRLTPRHVPPLTALLTAEADRHPPARVAVAWRRELSRLGPAQPADPATVAGLELALGLCATLMALPRLAELIPPPGSATTSLDKAQHADPRQLSKVRALLAKAESTDFAEEAEALSAKAQELISRYALGRLVDEADERAGGGDVTGRRLWIDAPYVTAKAMLVDAVASANRCRAVVSEYLGVSTIVGRLSDLEAVELLATSLLVQANAAMLRCGRQSDWGGTSRTTSFRRSFLLAYAARIGERLRAATREAAEGTARGGELVPVLRRHEQRVQAAFDEMFPEVVSRATTISNGRGWAAGRAAADLARLDTRRAVDREAG